MIKALHRTEVIMMDGCPPLHSSSVPPPLPPALGLVV
jgi:hypothetical protein